MRKVVVTGGAGFIGSHLTDHLLKQGYRVTVIDNFSNGSKRNLETVERRPLELVEADVRDAQALQSCFQQAETVYHLAALADIIPSIQRPYEYYDVNVTGTVRVMEAAKLAGIRQVIYAASSSCYGIPDTYPTSETAAIRPQYPYALTKFLGEEIVLHWGGLYKMRTNSLRFFNVYGPRARTKGAYGAMFKVFLPQILHGKPLTIVGDGSQTRDFTYVTDVVNAIMAVERNGTSGDIFNVGSGATVSINRIADLLGGQKTFIPKRPGEPDCTFADIRKIERLTGWKPQIPIEAGVKELLKHLDWWKNDPVWTPESIQQATRDWFHYLAT